MVQFFSDQTRFTFVIRLFREMFFVYRVVFMNKFRLKYPVFQSAKSLKKEAKIIDILAILSRSEFVKFNYNGRMKRCIEY